MKRSLFVLLALLVPALAFSQGQNIGPGQGMGRGRAADENSLLKSFGLTDAQVTQVTTIEKSTRDAVKADMTHIELVQAQIAEALLPANPDANAVNALIDKKSQFRTDIEKQLMAARIQLVKIMGSDNYAKFARSVMSSVGRPGFGGRGMMGLQGPKPGRIAPPMPGSAQGNS